MDDVWVILVPPCELYFIRSPSRKPWFVIVITSVLVFTLAAATVCVASCVSACPNTCVPIPGHVPEPNDSTKVSALIVTLVARLLVLGEEIEIKLPHKGKH